MRLLLLLATCASLVLPAFAEPLRVVTFSTILTEIAQRVGGDQVTVVGLIPPGVDPHEYEPKPADMKKVAEAQLVLLSAKHMEGYVGKLRQANATAGVILEVGDQFPSLRLPDGEDPHWWHSIDNMRRATRVVQDALTRLAPVGTATFQANSAAYAKELDALESWAKVEIAKLPRNQRKLVTSHDAFGYFARAFGFTVHPIEGLSSEDQPSSKAVADLIAVIKQEKVKAIFLESIQNPKVATEITRETGAKIGGTLFADGLGEGEAATYQGMFRHNVTTIVEALR